MTDVSELSKNDLCLLRTMNNVLVLGLVIHNDNRYARTNNRHIGRITMLMCGNKPEVRNWNKWIKKRSDRW